MKKEIIIHLSKKTDISTAIKKAMESSDKKYTTINPSQLQTQESTQEGTFNAIQGTARNTAG